MEAAVQETTVESTAAPVSEPVDQGDYIHDAFSDYTADPRDKAEPQAKEPKPADPNKAQEPKKEGDQTPAEKPKEGNTTDKDKKPDPFEAAFTNGETGEFDLDKLMGISLDGLAFQGEQKPEKPDVKEHGTKSDIPAWQQEYETERALREDITQKRVGPLKAIFTPIQQMNIPDEVKGPILDLIRNEYAKINQENDAFFRERDAQSAFRRRQEQEENFKSEIRTQKLPEIARANATTIINKLPGADIKGKAELYNRIMFAPDAGGKLLERMFKIANPGYEQKGKQEVDKMKLRFVHEIQSDGEWHQDFFMTAYAKLMAKPENMKRYNQQISRSTEAATKSNAAAKQGSPAGAVNRQPQAGKDKWSGYFANPEGARTRI